MKLLLLVLVSLIQRPMPAPSAESRLIPSSSLRWNCPTVTGSQTALSRNRRQLSVESVVMLSGLPALPERDVSTARLTRLPSLR
jgi:hypothetical protein